MADRYLLESGSPDGYLLEDGSGVLLLETGVFWDPISGFNKNQFLALTNSNLTSTSDNQGQWETVRANLPTAVSAFRFEVSLVTGSTPTNIAVGIDDGTTSLAALNNVPGSANSNGVQLELSSTGWRILRGGGVSQGPFVSPAAASGQIVTVVVDKAAGTVAFLVNGTQIGVNETSVSFTNWYADVSGKDGATSAGIGNFSGPFSFGTGSAYDGTSGNSISGSSTLAFSPSATLLGQGAVSASSALTFAPSATLLGKGAVSGSSSLAFSPSGTVNGLIAGTSTLVLSPSATLLGAGSISGTSAVVFTPSATLLGAGAVSGSSTLTFAPSSTLLGKGAVVGSSTIVFSPSATLFVASSISGTTSLTFSGSGTLFGAGALLGSTALSLSAAATLLGTGQLQAASGLSFAGSAALLGGGQIAGSTSFSMTVSGQLVFGFTGQVKVHILDEEQAKPIKFWDGTAWVTKPLKYWTGTTWQATSY